MSLVGLYRVLSGDTQTQASEVRQNKHFSGGPYDKDIAN